MYYTSLAAAKLWFGSCPTRSWQLGSRQNRVWQLAKSGLAAGQPSHWGFAATERPIIQNRYNLSIVCPAFFLRAETVHHKYVKTHRNLMKRHKQHDSNRHHKLKSISCISPDSVHTVVVLAHCPRDWLDGVWGGARECGDKICPLDAMVPSPRILPGSSSMIPP